MAMRPLTRQRNIEKLGANREILGHNNRYDQLPTFFSFSGYSLEGGNSQQPLCIQSRAKEKSDTFGAYRAFEVLAERVCGWLVNTLMLDNTSEMSNEWKVYLVNRGIKLCQSVLYSLEMNSIAERMIRVLVEYASAMLWDARVPCQKHYR